MSVACRTEYVSCLRPASCFSCLHMGKGGVFVTTLFLSKSLIFNNAHVNLFPGRRFMVTVGITHDNTSTY